MKNYKKLTDNKIVIGNGIVLSPEFTGNAYRIDIYSPAFKISQGASPFDYDKEAANNLEFKFIDGKLVVSSRGTENAIPSSFAVLEMLWVKDRIYGHRGFLLIGKTALCYAYHIYDVGRMGHTRYQRYNFGIDVENIDIVFEVVNSDISNLAGHIENARLFTSVE